MDATPIRQEVKSTLRPSCKHSREPKNNRTPLRVRELHLTLYLPCSLGGGYFFAHSFSDD